VALLLAVVRERAAGGSLEHGHAAQDGEAGGNESLVRRGLPGPEGLEAGDRRGRNLAGEFIRRSMEKGPIPHGTGPSSFHAALLRDGSSSSPPRPLSRPDPGTRRCPD